MTKKITKTLKLPAIILIVLVAGCYPKGPEYYSDLDLTVTDYDDSYDFGAQKSYWMADTVEYITNIEDSEIDDADVQKLLQQIETNFTDRGYTRLPLDQPDAADFVITVSVIASKYTGVGWTPAPPWFPGWGWGPGWGGWYPPAWGGYYSYSYTTGSVITNWWDPQDAPVQNTEDKVPTHWIASFNGLVSSTKSNNASRIESSINQAFDQSPYIQSK